MNPLTTNHLEVEFAEHGPFLRALARRLVADHAAAEDLVQETYVAALSNKPASTSRGTKGLLPWLATVLRNRAALRRRTDYRRKAREQMVVPAVAPLDPATVASKIEVGRRLLEHVEALGPDYRAAIYLRYYEGLEPREIAVKLGVSVGTIKTRLARAMTRLRAQVDADDAGGREKWLPALCAIGGVEPSSVGLPVAAPAMRRAFSLSQWLVATVAAAAALALVWIAWPDESQLLPAQSPQAAAVVGGRETDGSLGDLHNASDRVVAIASEPRLVVGVVEDAGVGATTGTGVRAANVTVRSRLRVPGEPAPVESEVGPQQLRVSRSREVEVECTSDAQGRFQFELPAEAELLRVEAVGDTRVAEAVWSVWTNVTRPEPLMLTRYLRTAFAGEVIDPSGAPVAGARVALLHWEKDQRVGLERVTDGSGRFQFPSVPDSSWLKVERNGYVQVRASRPTAGLLGGWQLARVLMAPVATLELTFVNVEGQPSNCVQGVGATLADSESGLAAVVPGAFPFRARTKVTNGRATLLVPAGLELALYAGDRPFFRERDGSIVDGDDEQGRAIVLAAGERRALQFVSGTDVELRVTVLDLEGQPVAAGIDLNFEKVVDGRLQQIGILETDANGQVVKRIAAHERSVRVMASARGAGTTAGLRATQLLQVAGALSMDIELQLAQGTYLVGSVRDRDGNAIDANVHRTLTLPGVAGGVTEGGTWSTDERGAFRIPGVPGAEHRLAIESDEFATKVLTGCEVGGASHDVVLERPWPTRLHLQTGDPSVRWLSVMVGYLDADNGANASWPELASNAHWSRAVGAGRDERLLRGAGSNSRVVRHDLKVHAGSAELRLDSGPAILTIKGMDQRGEPRTSLTTGPVRIPEGEVVLPINLAPAAACRGRVLFAEGSQRFAACVALADDQGRLLDLSRSRGGQESKPTLPTGSFGHFTIETAPAGTWELRVGTRQQLERGEAQLRQRIVLALDRDEPIIVRL